MGNSRDSRHKRRLTGGRMPIHKKKRCYEAGRPAANTRLGDKRIRPVRVMGGNVKLRALRLNHGNFNWQSEGVALKTKILNVVYNASNNELVRTNTLVKNTIVVIDATPFRKYLAKQYFGNKDDKFEVKFDWESAEDAKKADAKSKEFKYIRRRAATKIEHSIQTGIQKGQLFACISSRPGQCGRADGYLLEGKELEFYLRKIEKK